MNESVSEKEGREYCREKNSGETVVQIRVCVHNVGEEEEKEDIRTAVDVTKFEGKRTGEEGACSKKASETYYLLLHYYVHLALPPILLRPVATTGNDLVAPRVSNCGVRTVPVIFSLPPLPAKKKD